jgi:basic membrane protein A
MICRWIALALMAVGLAACGDSGSQPATQPSQQTEAIKVGLLVTGSTSDGGWNQLAADSLKRLEATQSIDPLVRQQVSKDAAADAIRQFDSRGYAVVFAHGYEYLDVVKELTNPENAGHVSVKIAVSGGDANDPHFASLFYDLSQASYQLGILAAKVSKTGKLGFVGGAPFPTVTAMKRGFEAGAKSVNPQATVAEQYTGWDDPSKAKRQVEAFIQQGCDVIMQNVDAASSGVFEAVKEHNARTDAQNGRVYTFGANSDQNDNAIASDYTLASAVIRMDKAFGKVVDQVKQGQFKGGLVKEDLASGVCVAVVNPKLVGTVITPEMQKLLDESAKKIAAGQITIPEK